MDASSTVYIIRPVNRHPCLIAFPVVYEWLASLWTHACWAFNTHLSPADILQSENCDIFVRFKFDHKIPARLMFNSLYTMTPSDAELATESLADEGRYRFPSFTSSDAITLGLSIRKRFRGSSRHNKGKGLVIAIQTVAGHTLFSCTVGDLGHPSGIGDVSLDSWACLEGMINVVKRTGHSSFYVEKGMSAMGKTPKQLGMEGELRVNGGAFPIWLESAPVCPIAVAACYSGSSQDDHNLVVTTVRDYLAKLRRTSEFPPGMPEPTIPLPPRESADWPSEPMPPPSDFTSRRPETPYDER